MEILNEVIWKNRYSLKHILIQPMNTFYVISMAYYNRAFPIQEVSKSSIYRKQVFNPWMTKGLQKSSKRRQKLYDKFLESKANENEKKQKAYKSLHGILKEKSKTRSFKNDIPKRMVIDRIETSD